MKKEKHSETMRTLLRSDRIISLLVPTFPSTRSIVFVKIFSSLSFSSPGSIQPGSKMPALLKPSMANLYSSWYLYA